MSDIQQQPAATQSAPPARPRAPEPPHPLTNPTDQTNPTPNRHGQCAPHPATALSIPIPTT